MDDSSAEPTGWITVRVVVQSDDARTAAAAALFAAGAAGVQELDGALVTHLRDDTDFRALRDALRRTAGTEPACTPLDAADWQRHRAPDVGVQRIGRVAVAPPWRAAEIADAELPIVIEPAMAFGTGEHESTRGVLRLMQPLVQPGDVVADLGAGSAVLAIAAAKLGAGRVAAIELDPDAIGNAEENVRRNEVADRVAVLEGNAAVLLPLLAPVQLVVANIFSSVIVELAPAMRRSLAPGGRAVLGGILVTERDHLVDVLAAQGWAIGAEFREGAWWSSVIELR